MGRLSKLEQLYLSGNRLMGEIPPELGSLINLKYLYLYGKPVEREDTGGNWAISPNLRSFVSPTITSLVGEIPRELGRLLKLETVIPESKNRLTGEDAPVELGKPPLNWKALYLFWETTWMGEIPGELGNLSKLIELHLDENHLSGQIPMELGQLTDLVQLSLSGKHIEWGRYRPKLGNLSNLHYLYLFWETGWDGCVPGPICESD